MFIAHLNLHATGIVTHLMNFKTQVSEFNSGHLVVQALAGIRCEYPTGADQLRKRCVPSCIKQRFVNARFHPRKLYVGIPAFNGPERVLDRRGSVPQNGICTPKLEFKSRFTSVNTRLLVNNLLTEQATGVPNN